MDAAHFRRKAAEARDMAELGEDAQLAILLLEVARDLDAEADAIEAGQPNDRRAASRVPVPGLPVTLRLTAPEVGVRQVTLTDLSITGARLAGEVVSPLGSRVTLELPSLGVRLPALVIRIESNGIAVAFAASPDTTQAADRVLRHVTEDRESAARAEAMRQWTGRQPGRTYRPGVARPASNSSDRNSASPLNFDEIGKSSSATSAS